MADEICATLSRRRSIEGIDQERSFGMIAAVLVGIIYGSAFTSCVFLLARENIGQPTVWRVLILPTVLLGVGLVGLVARMLWLEIKDYGRG